MQAAGLSTRAARLSPSPTLAISAKARAMRDAGLDVISLAAGEPDFPTPAPVCHAAVQAIEAGFTKYTNSSGIPELKRAIASKLREENGITVDESQVIVSCGAKQCLFNALMALVEPGDEVILLAPYWMTYAEQVELAGGRPVVVRTLSEHGFQPLPEDLRRAITSRTKAIVINTPCNPSGAVFSEETVRRIVEIAREFGLWIVSDEIYEKLIYEGRHVSPASLDADAASRTVTVNGCSKAFAMTGWRIGYAAAPQALVEAMSNLQDQVTSNPTSFAQKGALEALKMNGQVVAAMREEYRARRDLIHALATGIPSLSAELPQGSFYLFADVRSYLGGQIPDDQQLAQYLLEKAHTATIPGSVFDGPGYLRLSFASSLEDIRRGMERIAAALSTIL